MKSRTILTYVAAAIAAAAMAAGCGSKNTANTVTVTVASSAGNAIIVGQSTTLTATVTGGTTSNTAVNWQPCQFTTTTVSGTTATTSTPAACPTDGTLGTISNQQTTGTATYTAPGKIPDQTKYPGLQIVITAQSQQDTSKTGNVKLVLDSGISVTLTPNTAVTVPTNEPQVFTVGLNNDLQNQGVTWLLTQSTATTTITEPNLATCSPGCGSITSSTSTTATYTAPATIPTASTPAGASTTPASLTIVAISKSDNTRFATGAITIIQGGPITFNGITPTIAPQGAALWDIYLDAPNMSSASKIIITDQTNNSKTFSSSDLTNQIKVLFPIPTSTTPNPSSSGARLRLLESDLQGVSTGSAAPLTYTVSVTDPGEPVTKGSGPFTFTLMPVRPTVVASSPNGVVVQGAVNGEFPVAIDGGYFGPKGTFASASFQGNTLPQGASSTSRRLDTTFKSSAIGPPGLYPLTVSRTTPPLPTPNNAAAVTTVAVFPDYSASLGKLPSPTSSVAAGTNPSAIDIDPNLGITVVAETGSNAVQFYTIGAGSLTPSGAPVPVGQTPTGVSVNPNTHCVAVVNYGSQSVSIVPIPGSSCSVTTPTIDLSNAFQGQVTPAPRPYAIGVDPDTNLALVAFSSTSTTPGANLGFVVNLNQGANAFGCLAGQPVQTPPCIFSQVSLNTGQYPQVAVDPHGHRAYATPGGSGIAAGIDVTQPSTSIALGSLVYSAGTVTATTANSTPLTGLVPGIPTSVLISGVPPLTNSSGGTPATLNLNGVFSISLTSSTTFQYSLGLNKTGSATSNGPGTVFFGRPNLFFGGLSNTTQGIAINPISRTAALADPNAAAGQQINILNQLDQSFSSISFQTGCTAFTVPCNSTGELPGTARVAWQPYTNSIVSYNPGIPGTPVNQVSISDPSTRKRYALVDMPPGTTGSANITVQNGTLTLWGGVAVDPATNQAFVVQSGSGLIQIVPLSTTASNAQKPTEITEVVVQPSPGVIGGIPNALVPQATLTSTSDLAGVQIFGSGFVPGAQVLLDNTDITTMGGTVQVAPNSTRLITATIPAKPFLLMPHRFALQVVSGGFTSNPSDFIVVAAVDMTKACAIPTPSSVAIADQLKNLAFSPIAVVTNSGCNSISMIDINPTSPTFGMITNPFSTTLPSTLPIGGSPQGVAISQHLGLAVVANNGAGTASVVDLVNMKEVVPDVTVGTSPIGVAVNEATGVALVANFGTNTVSQINLGLLSGSSPATSLTAATIGGVQSPIAVAIDPDRGTNNRGLALVTGLQLQSGGAANGALYPVDIGLASPSLSTSISIGSVSSSPTGIVFNPAVSTGTANPGLFFVNSSGANQISSFNPDNNAVSTTSVGINPTALAVNPQTGAILTSNFAGKSVSIVDTLSNPIKTVQTFGLPGSVQFGVAIDPFTNLAVIVDQAHNRVLLFPMPN
jgi:DNA-binding beta-propeller fold protein YncE